MRALLAVTVSLSWACAEQRCLDAQEAARAVALDDARACAYRPDDLPEPDCARFDARVRRAYVGVFCATATLECIAAEGAEDDCFGRPEAL